MRDSNERLLSENKKLHKQIQEHEAKEKSEELEGQEQLLAILKNQTSRSNEASGGASGAREAAAGQSAKVEENDANQQEEDNKSNRSVEQQDS